MSEFTFKVNLVAVVRARAADESVARQVVSTILGAPGTVEIGLANENNAAVGNHATITDVDFSFSLGSIKRFGGKAQNSTALRWATPSRHQGLESVVDRPTTVVEIVSVTRELSHGESRACGTGVSFPRTPDGRGCAP